MARKVSKKDKVQPEVTDDKKKRAVKPAKARVKRAVSEKPPVEEVALPRLIKKKPISPKGTLKLVESLDKLALKYNEGQPLLDKLTDSLRELTGFNSVQIVVLDEQRGWRFKSTSGSSSGLWDLKNFTLPGGFEEVFLPGMKEKPNYFTADGSLYFPRLDELPGEIEEPLTGFLNSAVERYGFNSLALVPIERENEVIGFVQLADGVSGSITSEEVEAVESITAPLQVALERSGLKDEMRRQRESLLKQMHERNAHLEALSERLKQEISDRKNAQEGMRMQRDLALELNETDDLDEALKLCLETAIRVAGMDSGGIYLVDECTGDLNLISSRGLPPNFVKNASHFEHDDPQAQMVMKGTPVYSRHHELGVKINGPRKEEGLRVMAAIPILHENRVVACLNLASHKIDEVPYPERNAVEVIAAQVGSILKKLKDRKALQESEEKYSTLVENAREGVIIIQDGLITYVNRATKELTGYLPEEVIGIPFTELIEAGWQKTLLGYYNDRMAGRKAPDFYEFKAVRKNGIVWDANISTKAVTFRGQLAIMAIVRDITERKQAESALQESEERLQTLADYNRQLNEIYISFTEASSRLDLCRIIAESYRLLTGAVASSVALFDSKEGALKLASTAIDEALGKQVEVIFNGKLFELEYHIPPEVTNIMLSEIIGRPKDLFEMSWGTISREKSDEVMAETGCESIIGLSLNYGSELAGTAIAFLSKAHCEVPDEILKAFAYMAGLSIIKKKNEDSLRASEEKYRRDFENASDVIYTLDRELRLISVSPSVERILGYNPEEIIGKKIGELEFVAPESLEKAFSDSMRVFEGEHIEATTYTFIARDGSRRVAEISGSPVYQDGEVIGLVSVGRDVTERTKFEKALHESEEKYRVLVENASIGVIVSENGSIKYANPRTAEIYGGPIGELIGREIRTLLDPEDNEIVTDRRMRRMKGENVPDVYSVRATTFDGRPKWIEIHPVVIDWDGKPAALIFLNDVTERKKTQDALCESEARLFSMLQGSSIPTFVIGDDHAVRYWNTALEKLSGIKSEDIIGTRVHWKAFYSYERPCMADVLVDGVVDKLDEMYAGKYKPSDLVNDAYEATDFFPELGENGKWLRFTAAIIRNDKGILKGAIETLEDITEHKLAEHALRESEQKFKNIVEHITDIFYIQDANREIIYISPQVEQVLGYSLEEMKNGWQHFLTDNPDNLISAEKSWTALETGEKQSPYMLEFRHKDGSLRITEINESPLKNDKGEVFGIVGAARDMTGRIRAEAALRQSEEKYRTILDAMEDAYYEVNLRGDLTFSNMTFAQLLGYEYEEMLGMNYRKITPDEEKETVFKAFNGVFETGEPVRRFIRTMIRKDGRRIPVEHSAFPLLDDKGNICGFRGVIHDITERLKADEALKESEEKFRQFFENAPVYCYRVSPDGVILEVNKTVMDALGYAEEDLVGKPVGVLYAQDYQQKSNELLQKWLETGSIRDEEMVALTRSGERRTVLLSVSTIRNARGEPISTISVQRDITDRKKAEEALRQSEFKYGTILNDMDEGYYELDLKGNFTFVNDAACRAMGYSQNEMIGMNYHTYQPPETWENLRLIFGKIFQDNVPQNYETAVIKRDGGKADYFVNVFPLHDQHGRVIGFRGLTRDITALKAAEEEIKTSAFLLDSIYDDVVACDLKKNIIYANESYCRNRGYTRDELLTMNARQIVPPDRVPLLEERFRLTAETGQLVFEAIHVRKDGSQFDVEACLRFVYMNDKPIFIIVYRDITERKQMQQAVVESEAKYRSLVETGSAGIAIVNMEGEMTFVNDTICQMTGYMREELIGRPFAGYVYQDDLPELTGLFMNGIERKRGQPVIEFRLMCKDGRIIWIYTIPTELSYRGRVVGFSTIMHNITELKLTEQSLRESEVKFREISELLPQVVFEADVTGRITYLNKYGYETFGYSPVDVENGIYMAQFMIPEDRKRANNAYFRILEGVKGEGEEFSALKKDGSTFSSLIYVTPVFRNNVLIGMRGVLADITVVKEAEKAVRESEEKYRSVVENAKEGILVIQDGQFKYANDTLISISQYTREEGRRTVTQGAFIDLIHPDDRDMVYQNYLKRLNGESSPTQYEFRFIDKDGSIKWVDLRATQFNWESRPATLAFITDITARKQAEEALKESEARYRLLAENALDVIFTTDMKMELVYVSPSVRYIIGWPADEILKLYRQKALKPETLGVTETEFQRFFECMKALIADPTRTQVFEFEFAHRDGFRSWGEIKMTTMRDRSGQPAGILGIIRDVTQQKKMTEKLISADRLASLGEMAAGLAHEVNNPLTAVMGFAYLLQQNTSLAPEARNDVEAIYKEGKRAADVIRNFLLFARGQKLEKQSVYINDIIEGVLRLRHSQMLKENIAVILNLSDDLPAVQGDVSHLQQLFLNMILNAEYFMYRTNKRGNLIIQSTLEDDKIRVAVTDDGPGIPKDKLGRVFDPFFTTKDVGDGTGLGLSICHGIAREHGGNIRVESEPGKGATFIVELPAGK